mgnify:FL=1
MSSSTRFSALDKILTLVDLRSLITATPVRARGGSDQPGRENKLMNATKRTSSLLLGDWRCLVTWPRVGFEVDQVR